MRTLPKLHTEPARLVAHATRDAEVTLRAMLGGVLRGTSVREVARELEQDGHPPGGPLPHERHHEGQPGGPALATHLGHPLLKAGVPLATVQRILRHSDPAITTEVYGHLDVEDMHKGLDRLDFVAPDPAPTE